MSGDCSGRPLPMGPEQEAQHSANRWRSAKIWLTLAPLLIASCVNPFFPPLGPPRPAVSRQTPKGVLKQLVRAYELRRLTLFEDLFAADGSFRYYIPLTVAADFAGLSARATLETIDRRYAFIDSGAQYEFTRYSDEIAIHKNMFEKSEEILFMVEPDIDSVYYYAAAISVDSAKLISYDSLMAKYDTVMLYDTLFDTLAAEVLTKGLAIRITSTVLTGGGALGYTEFEIGPQVFYLQRDPHDSALWIIDKWFELP